MTGRNSLANRLGTCLTVLAVIATTILCLTGASLACILFGMALGLLTT